MQNYWFESLPESCPPADSEKCQGIYYRVAIGNPAQSEDFFSQKKLAPVHIPEHTRSLSGSLLGYKTIP